MAQYDLALGLEYTLCDEPGEVILYICDREWHQWQHFGQTLSEKNILPIELKSDTVVNLTGINEGRLTKATNMTTKSTRISLRDPIMRAT